RAYQAIPIVPRERDLAVVNVLRYHEAAGALVFCATRDGVTHLAANLRERGFPVVALSGELSQRERNEALQALRDGRARVCVATDVAARGLDLPDLGLVIHADLPRNGQMLVHRSGRTGRAAEDLVAALVHLRREARPAPEELTPPRAAKPPPPQRRPTGDGTWFTINIGRSKNADPKWLVPLLCRRGGITKRAIGKFHILARETRVMIANDVADAFAEAVRRPDEKDRNIHIEKLDE